MSMEHDNQDLQGQAGGADASAGGAGGAETENTAGMGGGAGDLGDVLGNGDDAAFVSGEEKKSISTGTIIMAGLLLACGAGTYFMYNRSAPAAAAPNAEAAAAQTTIKEFLADGTNANKMKDLLENTDKAVEQFRASPGKKQVPVGDLTTNPFRVAGDDGKNVAPENLDALTLKRRQEAAKAEALKAASALKLKFVMSGRVKSCMIDDKVYKEGQTVGEFTVETINTDSVILRKDEQRFKLPLSKK